MVEVRDNGIGIAPEDRAAIFRYRVRSETGRRHSCVGSGLGLAVVAVSQMEGEVHVESRPGEGSAFRIRIPRPPGR
ncbi:MAG TPA: ATP-binding protein [Longimicrobiales bacterium]|nr:ATP-binding protein [Longimicrobiales bacterium]